MSEYNETSVNEGTSASGGNAQSGGKPYHRRGKGHRPYHRRDNRVQERGTMTEAPDASVPELTDAASDVPYTDGTDGESNAGTVGERRLRRRPRGRRGGRNNRGEPDGRSRIQDGEISAADDTITDGEDFESETASLSYTESERDIVAHEVHDIITEERMEAAVAASDDAMDADASEETSSASPADAEPEKVPVEVVGVRFKAAGKVYYFAPDGGAFRDGDCVIVETARGIEFGFVVGSNRTVMATELVSPLKKVLRPATAEDKQHYEENNLRREEAFRICREKIEEHKIDMKLVDVEYTFDNSKLLFYFTADGRVDFRELVKDLAAVFRTRIELRQIGIRDEAKLMGGLGVCGRPFCCHSFLSDFVQVSIKMAKEQNLSLNSAKISGTCGRLMCCLRYEYDVYEEELKKTPKQDTVVDTPDGEGVVCEVIPLAGLVRVRFIGNRADASPKLYHRDDVKVKGKMNWKSGNITYHEEA